MLGAVRKEDIERSSLCGLVGCAAERRRSLVGDSGRNVWVERKMMSVRAGRNTEELVGIGAFFSVETYRLSSRRSALRETILGTAISSWDGWESHYVMWVPAAEGQALPKVGDAASCRLATASRLYSEGNAALGVLPPLLVDRYPIPVRK